MSKFPAVPAVALGLIFLCHSFLLSRAAPPSSSFQVEMIFPGINQTAFNRIYAAKTAAVLANVTGVEITSIQYDVAGADDTVKAQDKDFDSWGEAPACSYKHTGSNSRRDKLGRPWGYESGASCAFKNGGNAAAGTAASAPPSTPSWDKAPDCQYKLTQGNALPDKTGRLWGYDTGTGTSCAFKSQSLTAPAPAPAPAPAVKGGNSVKGARRMLLQTFVQQERANPANKTKAAPAAAASSFAVARYSINASNPTLAQGQLIEAAKGDGEVLYSALRAGGIDLLMKPSVSMEGQQLLTGAVPSSVLSGSQGGLPGIYDAASLAAPANQTTNSSSDSSSAPQSAGSNPLDQRVGGSALSLGALVGIVAGGAVLVVLVAGVCLWCCCCRKRKEDPDPAVQGTVKSGTASEGTGRGTVVLGVDALPEEQKPNWYPTVDHKHYKG
eukprot:gene12914-13041_t